MLWGLNIYGLCSIGGQKIDRKEYDRKYRLKNLERIREKDRIRDRTDKRRNRKKNDANRKERHKKYMREFTKKPIEKMKHNVRQKTHRKFGKVQTGMNRHHPSYDDHKDFVLVSVKQHGIIHRKYGT